MHKNPTGRLIRCPECFAKDIDVFLDYDDEIDEYYCCKCCFTGNLERVNRCLRTFVENKYPGRK